MRSVRELRSERNEKVRFMAYSTVGFGLPALVVIIAAIMEWSAG